MVQMIIDKYYPVSMKEEVLPEIPEEDVPQAQSMYEQLRKTSQKWFTRSQHRIFPPSSRPNPNPSLSDTHIPTPLSARSIKTYD